MIAIIDEPPYDIIGNGEPTIGSKPSTIIIFTTTYKNIIKNYPESKYTPESAMKLGEYFYAKGLYTQSANILKNIPQF